MQVVQTVQSSNSSAVCTKPGALGRHGRDLSDERGDARRAVGRALGGVRALQIDEPPARSLCCFRALPSTATCRRTKRFTLSVSGSVSGDVPKYHNYFSPTTSSPSTRRACAGASCAHRVWPSRRAHRETLSPHRCDPVCARKPAASSATFVQHEYVPDLRVRAPRGQLQSPDACCRFLAAGSGSA